MGVQGTIEFILHDRLPLITKCYAMGAFGGKITGRTVEKISEKFTILDR